KKEKSISLHLFMVVLLLLGLLQPSLALAENSVNREDGNLEETLIEEVDESVETEGTMEERKESTEEEESKDETSSEEQSESTEVENNLAKVDSEGEELIQKVQTFQAQAIDDIISDVYLDGNEVSIDNNETDLVIHVTEEDVMLHLINIYDTDGDL